MGAYRARDIVNVPGFFSLSRVPLAVAFPLSEDPWVRLGIVAVSGVTDLLDGWWARTFGAATPTGAALDPVTDKIFVLTVVGTLVAERSMPWWSIGVLAVRDIAELPLVVRFVVNRAARKRRAGHPKANLLGKLATAAQFAAIAGALFQSRHSTWLVAGAGVMGAIAAVGYWREEMAASGSKS